jgi:Protein of unknown function (DUF3995)
MTRCSGISAAAGLGAVAAVHVAWGLGSSFPAASRAELADAVVGQAEVPPPAACFAVAAALLVGAGMAADVPIGPGPLRRVGRSAVATVLVARGLLGLAGQTDLVSPGSTSLSFRRLDRRVYAPLCLALGALTINSSRESTRRRSR